MNDKSETRRYFEFSRLYWKMPPIDISDVEQVSERINAYFTHCEKYGIIPSVVGMSCALGVSRQTLYNWKTGKYREKELRDIICRYLTVLEAIWTTLLIEGKMHPTTAIFLGKNHFGYSNNAETDVYLPDTRTTISKSIVDLEKKYLSTETDN